MMHSCQILSGIASGRENGNFNPLSFGSKKRGDLSKAFGSDGQARDPEFGVEETAAGSDIMFHSNGGVSRRKPAFNFTPDRGSRSDPDLAREARTGMLATPWGQPVGWLRQATRLVHIEAIT
jgi:hypothetical protein